MQPTVIKRVDLTTEPEQVKHYVRDEPFKTAYSVSHLIPDDLAFKSDEKRLRYVADHIRSAMCLQCHDLGYVLTEWNESYAPFMSEPERFYCSCQTGKDLTEREYNVNRLAEIDMAAEEAGW